MIARDLEIDQLIGLVNSNLRSLSSKQVELIGKIESATVPALMMQELDALEDEYDTLSRLGASVAEVVVMDSLNIHDDGRRI